ncbi:MAG: hypothetical protein PW843_22820 [Azospirillaceae bacterium]|nr:hypothetical protein [Azospirillaceae bacterium]
MEKTAIYEPQETGRPYIETACRRFKPSEKNILKWLRKTREVTSENFNEEATTTECYAEGYLTTRDGQRLNWTIDMGGSGFVKTPEGKYIYLVGPDIDF